MPGKVICCPVTDATRGLLGAKELAALKPSAYVIGVGRPGVLDLEALAKAAAAKKIAGAAIDLAERSPEKDALRSLANVTVSEHAANSPEANERRWRLVRENVRRFVAGEALLCVVER